MPEAKNISNLPVETSIQWAKSQEVSKETADILRYASTVQQYTQIEVVSPLPSELEFLLGSTNKHPTWALFAEPKKFKEQAGRLFGSTLFPGLGSEEEQKLLLDRVTQSRGEKKDEAVWEEEKSAFKQLLSCIREINKNLIEIKTHCTQYQKG